MVEIQWGQPEEIRACANLAVELIGSRRGQPFIRAAVDRRQLLVARDNGDVVGCLAYRTDWFNCTFVSLVVVQPDRRRKGIARALYRALEAESPTPRLFSSAEETNVASIRMHSALGFTPSGYIDNLPQGCRELLFYKRLAGRLGGEGDRVSVLGDDGEASHV
ncbi:MAG: GNAT family N-acetyltransferase [Candidatus Rokubacteria bacterium]|nr:GNAT family N-acetyltransferase [Candidatus Rokubacteria bacterium]